MMRKARLAIRKVNVALDSPGYYFGTGRSLIPSSHLFVSARISSKRERLVSVTALSIPGDFQNSSCRSCGRAEEVKEKGAEITVDTSGNVKRLHTDTLKLKDWATRIRGQMSDIRYPISDVRRNEDPLGADRNRVGWCEGSDRRDQRRKRLFRSRSRLDVASRALNLCRAVEA
jgi:hypothetical protein